MSGFFSSESPNSSKRLVGIIGSGFLYWTLYTSTKTGNSPSDALVWGTVTLICVSLGLTSIKDVADMVSKFKGNN